MGVGGRGESHCSRQWGEGMSTKSKFPASLPNRLLKTWQLPHPAAININKHGKNIKRYIPAHFRTIQTQITFNSLPTDTRRKSAKMTVPTRGPVTNPHPCYLCGIGPDTTKHIFTNCIPVQRAKSKCLNLLQLRSFSTSTSTLQDPTKKALSATLSYPPKRGSTKLTNFTIVFNWSTWTYLRRYYHHLDLPDDDTNSVTQKLFSFTMSIWNS